MCLLTRNLELMILPGLGQYFYDSSISKFFPCLCLVDKIICKISGIFFSLDRTTFFTRYLSGKRLNA